jgi:hypothetical protein
MQAHTEPIEITRTDGTRLPLGLRKIYLEKIPLFPIKCKLLVYNERYRFHALEAAGPCKPVSKILN